MQSNQQSAPWPMYASMARRMSRRSTGGWPMSHQVAYICPEDPRIHSESTAAGGRFTVAAWVPRSQPLQNFFDSFMLASLDFVRD